MLIAIQDLLSDRRDRREMLNMRATMVGTHTLLFPQDEMTGVASDYDPERDYLSEGDPETWDSEDSKNVAYVRALRGRTYSNSRIDPPDLTTRPISRRAGTCRSSGRTQKRNVAPAASKE